MTQDVPPIIEPPKSLIGVSGREGAILAVFVPLVLGALVLPVAVPLRIGLAVLLAGGGVGLAFGRFPQTGKTLEAYLQDRWAYQRRGRFYQRGAGTPAWQEAAAAQEAEQVNRPAARAWLRVRPLPLGAGLFLSVLSLSVLAALLAWAWLGGIEEVTVWFGPGFSPRRLLP